jgi:beta-1,4-mannosyl-glycoprotein beta-1,4-N-acetylglucosaminyltransferase
MSMRPRVYDCFTFYDELDLLELRLAELAEVVDRFVLVEAKRTFQGNPKPLVFEQAKGRFAKWSAKIEHVIVDFPTPLPRLSHKSRSKTNKVRAEAWDREFYQRNQIMRGLSDARPDDIVIVSDSDEILRREIIEKIVDEKLYVKSIVCLHMPYYRFFLNCKVAALKHDLLSTNVQAASNATSVSTLQFGWHPSHGQWNGPHLVQRRYLTTPSKLRLARVDAPAVWQKLGMSDIGLRLKNWRVSGMPYRVVIVKDSGWHFSTLGGYEAWVKKVESFSHTEFKDTVEYSDEAAFDAWFKSHEIVDIAELPKDVRESPEIWGKYLYAN